MAWTEDKTWLRFRALFAGIALAIVFAFMSSVSAPAATTHYIASNGSDGNNGTTKTSAWLHLPGMPGCTGGCASYTPAAGDSFILRGGDTWPHTNFPVAWPSSGSGSSPIYIGVDKTWYSGTLWARPIFDGGGANISNSMDVIMDFRGQDNLVVDNIEFNNFGASGFTGAYGNCSVLEVQGLQNITIKNIYVHNIAVNDSNSQPCYIVQGATYAPFGGNSVLENSVFTGNGNTFVQGVEGLGNVKNNIISGMFGMVYPMGHGEISGNLLFNCGYPSFPTGASGEHGDAIQVNGADGAFYIHDNVIHDTGSDSNGNECEASLYGNPGETDYVWNNVLYNIHGNSFALTQNSSPGIAAYFWNNTVEGGQDGSGYCIRAGHSGTYSVIQIQNNHCISSQSQANDPGLSATSMTVSNNVVQTAAAANANTSPHFDQYSASQAFAFSVVASTNSTVGAGANLTTKCTGAAAGLCSDTSYACALQTLSGVVQAVCAPRTPSARSTTGAWGAGAYQGLFKAPAPPVGLTNVIRQP